MSRHPQSSVTSAHHECRQHHGWSIGRYAWAAIVVASLMLIATVTRAAILVLDRPGSEGGVGALPLAFAAGVLFDLLVALWLALPFVAYLTLVPQPRFARRGQRLLRRTWMVGALFGACFVAVAEVMFFDEFDGRFNFVAVDYLIYPTEVVTNIWQSYPVGVVLAVIGAFVALSMYALRPMLSRLDAASGPGWRSRLGVAGVYAACLAGLTLAVSPRLSHVSTARDVNELAASGYVTFWQALLGRDAPYDGLYTSRPDSVVFARMRELVQAPTRGSVEHEIGMPTDRWVPATMPERRMNVVVVLEESLGAEFIGALHPGDSVSLTPRFDSLASEGTLLTHAYSTGNRTIRALEATTASLPPLPGISIVRRAGSVNLFTLPSVLRSRGYSTTFVYGGRALFDGMDRYMRNNGVERVIEQHDFPDTLFTTAWGVSDEAIFDRALVEMDSLQATGTPFYTLVLSVSNHRPYTYPAGRIPQDPAEKRRVFAVRYADWALGRFMREARSHPFFDNTLFVLMGDHGPRVYGAAEIPLPSYEVPILFYAPGVVPVARRITDVASSLDVPPTILGILGAGYHSRFFGRDVLHDTTGGGRALMGHNAELALLRGGRMAVLGLRGTRTLYDVDSLDRLTEVSHPTPSDRVMLEDVIAWYQSADHLYRSGRYEFDERPPGAPAVAITRSP
ncbi:MAG TPA: LTA synthase family protein [Gemmatimonadaceae bacterium]|nr:LTA synthase family protein [Gemmatimonadaceae bacterium]